MPSKKQADKKHDKKKAATASPEVIELLREARREADMGSGRRAAEMIDQAIVKLEGKENGNA